MCAKWYVAVVTVICELFSNEYLFLEYECKLIWAQSRPFRSVGEGGVGTHTSPKNK